MKKSPFNFLRLLLLLLGLLLTQAGVAQMNIMIGSANDQPIPGNSFEVPGHWTLGIGAQLQQRGTAPAGIQVLSLRGAAVSLQVLHLSNDGCYRFDIMAAQEAAGQSNGFRIRIDGTEVLEATPADTLFEHFHSVAFTLSAGTHTINISGINTTTHEVLLDDLHLDKLPCWSKAGNWSQGSVPDLNDIAVIEANDAVVLDTAGISHTIRSFGELLAANNLNLSLEAEMIMIKNDSARMEWGQANTPYEQNGVITLRGNILAADTTQTAALMVRDTAELQLHGQPRVAWTNLNGHGREGDTQIRLAEVVDWEAGDSIVIASTDFDPHQAEVRAIDSVGSGGMVVYFTAPLVYNHFGLIQKYPRGSDTLELDQRAEVGLLTRNLRIQGDADAEIDRAGGHIMIMDTSFAQVSGVEFFKMGQEDVLGRYPFHWHLTGDLTGQYLKNSSIHISYNRVVTVHSSHNALIEDNIAYDHIGNGYFLENGDETNNRFIGNLGILTRAAELGKEVRPYDRFPSNGNFELPATFWITHPSNDFIGNVAAGSEGSGFWMVILDEPIDNPPVGFPAPKEQALGIFDDNKGHSNNFANYAIDLDINPIDTTEHKIDKSGTYKPPFPPVVKRFTSYKAGDRAIWMRTESMDFDSCSSGDNSKSTFFSYHNVISNSLYVGISTNIGTPSKWNDNEIAAGHSLPEPDRSAGFGKNQFRAHPLYDGPSGVLNCHFANFTNPYTSIFSPNTAATKSTVHFSEQLTFDTVNFANKFANNLTPDRDYQWTTGIIDLDGSIDALTNPGDIIKPKIFPIDDPDRRLYDTSFNVENGAEFIADWDHFICQEEHYGLLMMDNDWASDRRKPMYSIRSDGHATLTEGQTNKNQIPVILSNPDYRYYLQYHSFPDELLIQLRHARQGDVLTLVVLNVPSNRFIGKASGIPNDTLVVFNDLNDFENNGSTEGYWMENNTLYVRLIADQLTHNQKQFGSEYPYTTNIKMCLNGNCSTSNNNGLYQAPLADFENALDTRGSLSTSGNLDLGAIGNHNGADTFRIVSDGDGIDEYLEYRLDFHRQVWSEFNNLHIDFSGPKMEVLLHDQSQGPVPLGYLYSSSCEGLDMTHLDKEEIDQVDGLLLRFHESELGGLDTSDISAAVHLRGIFLDYARDLWDFHRNQENWISNNEAILNAPGDGLLHFSKGSDSSHIMNNLFKGNAPVNSIDHPYVVLKMNVEEAESNKARFYYAIWNQIGQTLGQNFTLLKKDTFIHYVLSPNWTSNDVQRVRFDPVANGPIGDTEIDYIRFTSCPDCYNGTLDPEEEEVDCGGPNCLPCPCSDGMQNYEETGIDCGGDCKPCSELVYEHGQVSGVGENWVTVDTENDYQEMVIVATPQVPSMSKDPVVSRIRNTGTNSFELKIQHPGGRTRDTFTVQYFVVEAGVYTDSIDGINLEAWTTTSTATAGTGNWVFENHTLVNDYNDPVIIGQVQSYNDARWSAFWASKLNVQNEPPEGPSFSAGKHVAQDTALNRTDEQLGIIAVEAGLFQLKGTLFQAGTGADQVRGVENYSLLLPTPYTLSPELSIEGAVLSSAAMDGGDGGWPVLFTQNPLQENRLYSAIDEDQIVDTERSHTHEQVAYLAFGSHAQSPPTGGGGPIIITPLSSRSQSPLKLYPNPLAQGQELILETLPDQTLTVEQVQIIGAAGRSIPLRLLPDADHRLRISAELAAGVYFVQVMSQGVQTVRRLVVLEVR
ncbi:MAG: G8 domain-containing protein [Bacteroidota bacterium]